MAGSDSQILSRLIKRMQKGDTDPLRPLIDAYLIERDHVPPTQRYQVHQIPVLPRSRPGGRLSPSSIGGCERQAAFKFLGLGGKRRLDPDLEMIFEDGNWRHHRWQAIFLDMERVLGPERFRVLGFEKPILIRRLFIAGHLDVLVEIYGELYVIDIKGINERGFQYLLENKEPHIAHERQIMTYERGSQAYKGILFYENKNSNLTRSVLVPYNPEDWREVAAWCKRVLRKLSQRKLPPMHPECSSGNFLWAKCPYAHLCYGRKSNDRLEEVAYKNFRGLGHAWKQGLAQSEGEQS